MLKSKNVNDDGISLTAHCWRMPSQGLQWGKWMITVPLWGGLATTMMMMFVVIIWQVDCFGCERLNQTYQCHHPWILLICQCCRGTLFSHYYSTGGNSGAVVDGSGRACGEGNIREERAEEDNDGFLSSGGGKR